jgi:choice-of-anchor B domain-containing protein
MKVLAVLALAVVWLGAPGPSALALTPREDETPPPPVTDEFIGSPLYQQFLADQQPPHHLAPLAFTPCVGGMAGSYPCNKVDLLAFVPLANMGGGNGNVVWGWKDPVTNKEYALFGRSNGTAFIDISTPTAPVYIGNLPSHTGTSSWRDIRVYQNHAYIVSDNNGAHGVQVFDLTQLRSVMTPPVTFAETTWYNGISGNLINNGHTIFINEATGYAYVVGSASCSGGLHMINIQNPVSPTFAGCYSAAGYTHETQCVVYQGPDVAYQNHEICFNSNGRSGGGTDALVIVDVTTKTTPALIYTLVYTGAGYTHQTWLTPDFRYMLLDDELDEQNLGHNTRTRIFDVNNLDAPTLIGIYDGPTPAIDHNLYIKDGLVYEANYRAGLRVLDGAAISVGGLTEVGYFDIYPLNNNASFNGAWMAYPFFENGVVAISGIEQGLFLVKYVSTSDFSLTAAPNTLNSCGPATLQNSLVVNSPSGSPNAVSFSVLNAPSDLSVSFNPNPLNGNGAATMTTVISNTAVPGVYGFMVQAVNALYTHTAPVTLTLQNTPPTAPALVLPANNAMDQPLAPTLVWAGAASAASYDLQLATDPAFSNVVYSTTVVGTLHTVNQLLAENTLYYWRARGANVCGTGAYSAARSFLTRSLPPVLLVDDDSGPDVRGYYTQTLAQLAVNYDVWTSNGGGLAAPTSFADPNAQILQLYDAVIWFSGEAPSGVAGPDATTETELAAYLTDGGCLLLSSQNYYAGGQLTAFMTSYLGLTTINANANYTAVTGLNHFAALGNVLLNFPIANQADQVSIEDDAQAAFSYASGVAGVSKSTFNYFSTFWSFPAEALPPEARQQAIARFLAQCNVIMKPVYLPFIVKGN